MNLNSINDQLDQMGVTMWLDMADRGICTAPDGLADKVADLKDHANHVAGIGGEITDWRAVRDIEQRMGLDGLMYNRAGIITSHLQPALKKLINSFRTDLGTAGQYADRYEPAVDLLSEPAEVREAFLRLITYGNHYASLRMLWEKMRAGEHITVLDPHGVHSPLAEVANMPDVLPNWQAVSVGRAAQPWHGNAFHVRMAWLLRHGARVWIPTAQEHNQVFHQYNPNLRVLGSAS